MNDVSFTFGMTDRVTPVLREQNVEASRLGRTFKEIGQSAGKAGGPLGGLAGRVLGGAGGPFAVLAVGAALATTAIGAMNAASDRAITLAKEEVTWQQKLTSAIEGAANARRSVAAGGLSQASDTRLLLRRGGNLDAARANVDFGIELADSIKGESAIAIAPGDRVGLRDNARELAQTGEISFTDAVKRLADRRGPLDLRRELTDLRGQLPNEQNLLAAGTTLAKIEGFGQDSRTGLMDNITGAIIAGQQVGLAQSTDLTTGSTQMSIQMQTRDILNPAAKALNDLQTEAANGAAQLQAAATAQFKLSRMLARASAALGMGSGAAQDQLNDYRKATAVVNE